MSNIKEAKKICSYWQTQLYIWLGSKYKESPDKKQRLTSSSSFLFLLPTEDFLFEPDVPFCKIPKKKFNVK